MQRLKITRVANGTFAWGESACWDDALARLYCVDCEIRELRWVDSATPDRMHRLALPSLPTALYLTETPGRVLVELDDGLYAADVAKSEIRLAIDNPPGEPRFNDGVADPSGAIVTGTLLFGGDNLPPGKYWRYRKRPGWEEIHGGKGNTNGPCFSPDGRYLYIADSSAGLIYRFAYGAERDLGGQLLFADTKPLGGVPDGATVDSEGCLWSAIVGGSKLARYAPDGSLDRVIDLPASHPTSIAFGGPDFQTAFVTTIGTNSFGVETAGTESGALIRIDGLGVRGLARTRCAF
jgi:sugar lactone lactonase YvrE